MTLDLRRLLAFLEPTSVLGSVVLKPKHSGTRLLGFDSGTCEHWMSLDSIIYP